MVELSKLTCSFNSCYNRAKYYTYAQYECDDKYIFPLVVCEEHAEYYNYQLTDLKYNPVCSKKSCHREAKYGSHARGILSKKGLLVYPLLLCEKCRKTLLK